MKCLIENITARKTRINLDLSYFDSEAEQALVCRLPLALLLLVREGVSRVVVVADADLHLPKRRGSLQLGVLKNQEKHQ
jgi:hypothetical protein